MLAARAWACARRAIVFRHVLPNSLGAGDRAGHAGAGDRHHRRGGAGVPRPRPAGPARAGVGPDAHRHADATSTSRPKLAFFPGIAIVIAALGFTLLGEALREALDPKYRR